MKRFIAAALFLSLFASAAYAGRKTSAPIKITRYSTIYTVAGSLGSTRNSYDDSCFYCATVSMPGSLGTYAVCQAYSASDGQGVVCSTSDANLVQGISKLQGDQFVSLNVDFNGTCTGITNTTGSQYEPKVR